MLLCLSPLWGAPSVRLKDIAYLKGVRNNQLLGVGLVTGLGGKGDSQGSDLLQEVLSNLLSHFDITIDSGSLKSKNCAVVMVSLDVPTFSRPGDRVDLTASSIGDAKSLSGGILLQTNLKAANGKIYAVGQGKIVTPKGNSGQTVGNIPGGAIIEREVISSFIEGDVINLVLRNPDFVTANAAAKAIAAKFSGIQLKTVDAALIEINIPEDNKKNIVDFIAQLESLTVTPDMAGKVVIDPAAEIIIIGENVKVGKVAVSYKKMDVNVASFFSDEEENPDNFVLEETANLEDFVNLLRSVGLKTDTIIGMLQAIDKAGALYGRLIIM